MSKKDKLEAKIRNNPRNVSLDDFEALVNKYGHTDTFGKLSAGMGGKHAKARIGNALLTYKRVNPIPPEYVTDLLEIIDTL